MRILVAGAKGRMGSMACEAITQTRDLTLVARCGREDSLVQCIAETKPDVMLDLTLPDCVFDNVKTALECGVPCVVGTSGLSVDEVAELGRLCAKTNVQVLIVPNFSIAAVLMMRFSAVAARYLSDIEIVECHHDKKVDRPSGTAAHTQQALAQVTQQEESTIPIYSVRMPSLFAHQAVIFYGQAERLTIKHDANDRQSMMPGVLQACRGVLGLNGMHIGLESVLTL